MPPSSLADAPPTRLRRLLPVVAAAAIFLAVTACATVPRAAVPAGVGLTSLLAPDALAYASIKVARDPALVSAVLQKSGLERSVPVSIVAKTKTMYASIGRSGAGNPTYAIVARGEYPVGLIRWRFDWARDWRRYDHPLTWWQDRRTGAQLAVPTRNLLLASNDRLPDMLGSLTGSRHQNLNPTILQVFQSSDMAIYFPRVSDGLPMLGINARRFPIQSFYVAISSNRSIPSSGRASGSGSQGSGAPVVAPRNSDYRGYAVFRMDNARDARLFSVVFKLLIISAASGREFRGFPIPLQGANLELDGSTIRLQGIEVSEPDLVDLLAAVISGGST